MITTRQIDEFIDSQLKEWPMAASNFDALKGVEVKELTVDGMPVKVQFNPARAVSSGAKVDAASIKARKCFLCAENRPAEQKAIEWGDYLILINPFPIFPRHLTIPAAHTPQLIRGRVKDMMKLARELDGYTVFYNGPKCGASAPDHMHFQAGNSDFLVLPEVLGSTPMKTLLKEGSATLKLVDSLPLNVFVIDAGTPEDGAALFDRLYKALPAGEDGVEPMMNILCLNDGASVRLIVIPRKRHRPSFYGTEGEGTMMLSPASVDMGGVFITPRRDDYERIDENIIRQVFDELCLSNEEINNIAANVK